MTSVFHFHIPHALRKSFFVDNDDHDVPFHAMTIQQDFFRLDKNSDVIRSPTGNDVNHILCSLNCQLLFLKHEMTLQQPDHENNSHSGVSVDPSAPTPLPILSDKPSGPTLGTRLIIFSALVIPSALIPLLVLRRSVNNLHRKVDELKGATRELHHEFKSVMLELSVRREQHERLQAMIVKTRKDLTHLRRETYRRRKAHAREDERMQCQVQELVASNQYVNS